jgi:peptidoglycan/xylan/chitin deacetylase (PgdA/CDA1 family)
MATSPWAAHGDADFPIPDGHSFALCLTHDVDRPYKRAAQSVFYALQDRPGHHLRTLRTPGNPYWQFEEIAALEDARGVRSAFYVLNEPPIHEKGLGAFGSPRAWVEQLGRYDVDAPELADTLRWLADGGWEVGLHGSLASVGDVDRLAEEKAALEAVLGDTVRGGRQHRLRLDAPATWRDHRSVGLAYDATLGSATTTGFDHGYHPIRPFDDAFVVFPLTIMEQALPDPGTDPDAAWAVCEQLLRAAAEHGAVMTVLWHPRYFNDEEFPGYRALYERCLDTAIELGGWVGSPGALYDAQTQSRRDPRAPIRR